MGQLIAGFNTSHNGSACLIDDNTGELLFYAEEERYSRHKRDSRPFILPNKILNQFKNEIVALATSSCGDIDVLDGFTKRNYIFNIFEKYNIPSKIIPGATVFDFALSHHECHAYGAVYCSPFEECLVIVTDGAGAKVPLADGNLLYEFYTAYYFDSNHKAHVICKDLGVETNRKLPYTLDHIKQGHLGDIAQRFVLDNAIEDADIRLSQNSGIVKVYEAVATLTGNRPDDAGKVMGLAPYGNAHFSSKLGTDKALFVLDRHEQLIPNKNVLYTDWPTTSWINTDVLPIDQLTPDNRLNLNSPNFQDYADLAKEVQELSCAQLKTLIRRAINKSPNPAVKNIIITGGYGLNSLCNYELLKTFSDYNFYFYPISHDGGTSIGAAYLAYCMRHNYKKPVYDRLDTLYLGELYGVEQEHIEYCNNNNISVKQFSMSAVVVALGEGKTVALYQGRSEAGPRALGNRSILFNPSLENGKEIINKIKRREQYRPFAGTILKDHLDQWFDVPNNISDNLDFMTVVVPLKSERIERVPAIEHFGTCRIQTVTREQNKLFYEIINEFYNKTGCPMIGNTSFNLAGEPLVESVSDAIRTFVETKIDMLILNDILLIKSQN